MNRTFSTIAFSLMASSAAFCNINVSATYGLPGAQTANTSALCVHATTCIVGEENFETWNGGTYNSAFNSPGAVNNAPGSAKGNITGTYSGGAMSFGADQYGGAGGTGKYPEVFTNSAPETLALSTSGSIPGVNYFGLWFSALDNGNVLQFYDKGVLQYTFGTLDFQKLVGNCPSSGPAYCGNPNTPWNANAGQQYAYLNFFAPQGSYFDKVTFTETCCGGFESDNHAAGYINPIEVVGTAITPEPAVWGMNAAGACLLAACFGFSRRSRNKKQKTAA